MFDFFKMKEQMQGKNVFISEDQTKLYVLTRLYENVSRHIPEAKVFINPDYDPDAPFIRNRIDPNHEAIVEVVWNYENAQTLASLEVASVSPMLRKGDYEWTGKLTPFKHQYTIAAFLSINKRAFCLADMGTGKTLSTLHAINYLYQLGKIKKVLVVCPLSVMRDAWSHTIDILDSPLTCEILYSPYKQKRIDLINNTQAQIHIINPDGVEVISNELAKQKYDLIVIDELTTYKTHKTKRWNFLNSLTENCEYVWGITGTPVPNSPFEAYGQIKIVNPANLAGIGFSRFREDVNYSLNQRFLNSASVDRSEFNTSETSLEIVSNSLKPAIRVKKEDCLDLPDLVNTYLHCPLSPEQQKIVNQLRETGFASLSNGERIDAVNGAATVQKIIQACCGAVYDRNKEFVALNNKERIKETIRLIGEAKAERTEKNKGKTLVFVPFKSVLDILYNELSKVYKVAKINSDVREKERADIFNRLQNTDDLDAILAIPTTMSHGITATSASLIIWYAPIHSCETYIQACNRINRAGQTQKMTIAHLYGADIEARIYRSLERKQLNLNTLLGFYTDFIQGK